MLVNALVSAPVCPVYDDVATAVPTVVQLRRRSRRSPWSAHVEGPDGTPVEQRAARTDVPLHELSEAVAAHVAESHNPGNRQKAAPRRGRRAAAPAAGGPGDRRHPGRRRAELGARRGDDGRAADRGRGAAGLRRLAGVHRARSWSSCARRCGCARTWPACSPRPTSTRSGGASPSSTAGTCAPRASTPS